MWVTLPEFPTHQVHHTGRVRNKATKRLLKLSLNREGYLKASIGKRNLSVHRLVASAFLESWNSCLCVDHINRKRSDNRISNLRMASVAEQNKNRRSDNFNKGHRIPVQQWTLKGQLIQTFESIRRAEEDTGIKQCTIQQGLRQNRPAAGFVWRTPSAPDLPGEVWKHWSGRIWISNNGRVKKRFGPAKTGAELGTNYGYPRVGQARLHNAVAALFMEPPPEHGMVINHKDGNCTNADVSNLEWVTQAQNIKHAIDIGLRKDLRPVVQIASNGDVIAKFPSISMAQKTLSCCNIVRAIRTGHKAGGFRWKYY